ncbi:MAG: hypothetical protein HY319_06555 [Armatimonadetes bacterium]|nr:hypothetical protein [Armatimonadota bacterium]
MRQTLVILVLILIGSSLAWAQPDPPEDRIRQLEDRLEEQSRQIEALQETVRQLKEQLSPAPSADQPAQSTEITEDPGPEPPAALEPGTVPPSASATGQQAALNPNLSVNVLAGAQDGGSPRDDRRNSLFLEEVEIALQAPIDPNARADVFVSFPRNEAPEVEEATLTWLTLPGGLQAKGGLLKGDFGRINQLHRHGLPQIDLPLPNRAYFGDEGLRNPGAELSWLLPTPWYSRLSAQAMSRTGEEEPVPEEDPGAELEGDIEELEDLMAGQLDPAVLKRELEAAEEFTLFPAGGSQLMWVGRWENLFDLDEDTTLGIGMSGASARYRFDDLLGSRALGADLTLKWRPLDEPGRGLVWQTEYIQAQQDLADERRRFDGWYSFLTYQLNRNWSAGVRYDEVELPFDPDFRKQRLSFLLEWIPSEWNKLRLQYSNNDSNYGERFHELMFQWNIVLGPHGAHKY